MDVKKLLSETAKAAGIPTHAKTIWNTKPVLRGITTKYASLVGPLTVTRDKSPLLQSVIQEAVNRYINAGDDSEKADIAYIKTIIDSYHDCFCNRLIVDTDQGEVAWSVIHGNATDFIDHHQGKQNEIRTCYVENELTEDFSRIALILKIVPETKFAPDKLKLLIGEGN